MGYVDQDACRDLIQRRGLCVLWKWIRNLVLVTIYRRHGLVEMAISTNPRSTINRNLYSFLNPDVYVLKTE